MPAPPIVMASMKLFRGEQRLLRFEGDGVCVTLDLVRSAEAVRFLEVLDRLTLEVGGLPHIVKDSRLPAGVVARSYPGYEEFREQRRALDPAGMLPIGAFHEARAVTAVVVGASAGLGRALAQALAAAGHDLVVVSSDVRDLEALASDLRIRHAVRVVVVPLDLGAELSGLGRLREAASELGGPDALLLPIGWSAAVDDATLGADVAERLVRTNFLSVTAVVAALLPELRKKPRASVVGFGSVAAARGRGANMLYAASKRALQTWFEGLRHACAGTPVAGLLLRPRLPGHEPRVRPAHVASASRPLTTGRHGSCTTCAGARASCTILLRGGSRARCCRSFRSSSSSA